MAVRARVSMTMCSAERNGIPRSNDIIKSTFTFARTTPDTQLPGWVFNTKLFAKPDQLIKRRGKAGLLALNKTWDEAKEWIV